MRVVALDSTTRAGSVALIIDDGRRRTIDERAGNPERSQAERLPSDVLALLADHNLKSSDVDLFAVASGPGLFTGLRIGIATMQGFALVGGKPLIAVSALDALGQLASGRQDPGVTVAAWMNAYRGEVFAALYRVEAAPMFDPARLSVREDPSVGDPGATAARWLHTTPPAVVAGDGAEMYRDIVAAQLPSAVVVAPQPLAAAIGQTALERFRRGERGNAAGVQPLYVRRPDAELAREHAVADRTAHVHRSD